VFLVRKLGVPGQEELSMGAIASGGVIVLNEDVLRGLGIGPEVVEQVAAREGRELARRELARRERAYREGRPEQRVAGNVVILVDDGLATGRMRLASRQSYHGPRPWMPTSGKVAGRPRGRAGSTKSPSRRGRLSRHVPVPPAT
jgi:predicted phosphoribosyltransferase